MSVTPEQEGAPRTILPASVTVSAALFEPLSAPVFNTASPSESAPISVPVPTRPPAASGEQAPSDDVSTAEPTPWVLILGGYWLACCVFLNLLSRLVRWSTASDGAGEVCPEPLKLSVGDTRHADGSAEEG